MIGQTISQYKILEKLGEGGMGVVYKAQDTKLDRFVALKFLPPHMASSEQDKARFIQEAKSAAALNHPNVCSIIDIQEVDAQMFIVMEFVDGHTLQEKKSTLTQKQAIDYGIQIAEGLAAAHEKGIVHRDIKPENIMIRKDGIVQVMDFGLAKLVGASRLTKVGSTVGTLGYMSPEQVQGQETTHRSDIFSFGVLLYEMLTGKSPFTGAHESAILYEIVNVDVPPPSTIKPDTDSELDRIVLECMEKDPNERMQSIKQVAIDLNRFKRTSSRTRMSRTFPTGSRLKIPISPAAMENLIRSIFSGSVIPWIIAGLAIVSCVLWSLFLNGKSSSDTVSHLNIAVINSPHQIIARAEIPTIALSADGRLLAYTLFEKGISQIYVRSLDNFLPTLIEGTKNGLSPFFSPDGEWIGFVAEGKIKKVPLKGGSVETVCDVLGFRGAWWGKDDRIYFSPSFATAVMSVSSKGGDIRPASTLDTISKERTHRWPQVLPGGKYILYTVGDVKNPNSYVDAPIAIQSLETGERHLLEVHGEMARYVEPGYLIVARNGGLHAAPFDLGNFTITKPLSPLFSDVNGDPGSGVVDFTISDNGHLVYLSGTLKKDLEMVWVDLEGKVTPVTSQVQSYSAPRVSPDGKKVAVSIGMGVGSDNDIWVYDVMKATFNRLTFGKKMFASVWSADGKTISYTSTVPGKEGLYSQPADGSSEEKLLYKMKIPHYSVSASPNGKYLLINTEGGPSDGDIVMMEPEKNETPEALINTAAYESGGYISADGKHVLFFSNETGVFEVFVRSFPDLKGKWQISVNGGRAARWSPDGRSIYFINPLGKMMGVSVRTSPSFSADQPKELFDLSTMYFPNNPVSNYDIAPDGKRFVMFRNTNETSRLSSFHIVLNVTKELEQQFMK